MRFATLVLLIVTTAPSLLRGMDDPSSLPVPPMGVMRFKLVYPLQPGDDCSKADFWCCYSEHNPNNCEYDGPIREDPQNYDTWYGHYNAYWHTFDGWQRLGQGWGNPGDGVLGHILMAINTFFGGWGTGVGGPDPSREPHLAVFAPGGEMEGNLTEALASGATVCNGGLAATNDGPVAPPAGGGLGCHSTCCGAQGSVGGGAAGSTGSASSGSASSGSASTAGRASSGSPDPAE